ncbi:hypothetical protein [Pseudomonas sp. FW305-70]|uniref:hypothetical protein n=1 Tax=Pseudomonas sp. FW305-70 TaxID=2751342 RepID=UPI000C883C76|nr:hypothetical protein [Pseudomonas sp. FW305-70]PMZ74889.1 hypothetical protein C1X65_14935 [Pseudomonas sp. FW305-70]
MSEFEVFSFAKKMTDAVGTLRDAGHLVPAVMLTYAGIDQMAWLSIPQERSSAKDFKAWVEGYMLSKNPMACTASELWEARNGLLHTGTAESSANQNDSSIRKILYTYGSAHCASNSSNDTVFIKAEDLIVGYLTGVLWFMEDLKAEPAKLQSALEKLKRTLTSRGLPSD